MENNVPKITFSPLTKEDVPMLLTWFREPHVQAWWPVPESHEFFEKFLERIRSKNIKCFIAYADGVPFGYIQYYAVDRSEEKTGKWLPLLPPYSFGSDQFIGEPHYLGKGFGTLMVKEFIQYFRSQEPSATTLIVDPDPANVVAIRCYEKTGFSRMGNFDAPWGPALLMTYMLKK